MDLDYKKIGLKCGLEIHQQLNTGKLFSRTPSILREDEPHYTVKRMIRSVASETGEHDRAALEAAQKQKYYIYEGYEDTVSLVELDEEPPQQINEQALDIAIEFALLCKAQIIDELIVMRKNVADGSNTSGFQRTALLATSGKVNLENKSIGVQTIVIEEDAARPTEKTSEYVRYRLDRLGIPLIEIATEPQIESPEEAKQAALTIGNLLRLTGKVRRGLGTIRQDLNVSIKNGARVELKGVQSLDTIDECVKREVIRQLSLIEIKRELEKRGFNDNELDANSPQELNQVFEKTESKIIKQSLLKNHSIMGVKLNKFSGLLGREIQPKRRLGSELASIVRAKTELRGLFHSDELPNYGVSVDEVNKVKEVLGCSELDAFVIIAGPKQKAILAIECVVERAKYCAIGVPEETRGALEDGNSEYLRPLPGAARMYPETDLASIPISEERVRLIEKRLPKSLEEREVFYKKLGLSDRYVDELKLSNYANLFEKIVSEGVNPKRAAVFLVETLVEAKRNGALIENLSDDDLEEIIKAIDDGRIQKEVQTRVLIEKSKQPSVELDEVLEKIGVRKVDRREVEEIVQKIVRLNMELVKKQGVRAVGPLMGDVMKELRGKAPGNEVSEILKKEVLKASKNA